MWPCGEIKDRLICKKGNKKQKEQTKKTQVNQIFNKQ